MIYRKISPLGKREGLGTFDTLYDNKLYTSMEEAKEANDVVVMDFVKDEQDIIYIECYNVSSPEDQKRHRLNFQHFPAGLDVLDDSLACELATTLFKSYKEPIKETEQPIEVRDYLLERELKVTNAKFSLKTHTLRWLFYREIKNFRFTKNGWGSDKMCKECKKGISSYISFAFFDANGNASSTANCPECNKKLERVPNTTLIHKLYTLCNKIESGFWLTLDKLKLVRSGSRYGMGMSDESYCVKTYKLYFDEDKTDYEFFPRKWWQYIFIPKQK